MKIIESVEQLREEVAAAGEGNKKPLRLKMLISLIIMIQLRKAYSQEAEERYAECMKNGETLPAIKGVCDLASGEVFCYDGEHRLNAARKNGETHIAMELTPGTRRDATLNAAGVNDVHGVARTAKDKHNAVLTVLEDSEWRNWSSTRIAKFTRTSVPFVESLRQEKEKGLDGNAGGAKSVTRKVTRKGKVYNMKIPAKPRVDPAEAALSKIVKILKPFAAGERRRLVDAAMNKSQEEETSAQEEETSAQEEETSAQEEETSAQEGETSAQEGETAAQEGETAA